MYAIIKQTYTLCFLKKNCVYFYPITIVSHMIF